MEIKNGKYKIQSDSMNLWVEEEYTDKNGKPATKKVAGYSRTLPELFQSFIDAKLRGSDARSTEVLLEHFSQLRDDLIDLVKGAGNEL